MHRNARLTPGTPAACGATSVLTLSSSAIATTKACDRTA